MMSLFLSQSFILPSKIYNEADGMKLWLSSFHLKSNEYKPRTSLKHLQIYAVQSS